MKPKEEIREFKVEDSVMLGASNVTLSFFTDDLADFIAYDSIFNAPYAANWQAAITAAETYIRDNAVIDQQAQLTNAVKLAMKNCCNHYQQAKYYIDKAFPDDVAVQNEFGYNDYDRASSRQIKLVEFMHVFYAVATKYKVKLIAADYTQAKITEINTLKAALNTANLNQDKFKGSRLTTTQDRVILLNAAWKFLEQVCKAGKMIYVDNYAKYQHYLLPDHSTSPVAPTVIKLPVNITIAGTIIVKMAGNASATGIEQVNIDHGDGYETVTTLLNGNLIAYSISYIAAGQFNMQITPITPGSIALIDVLQIDNCNLYGTLEFPDSFRPSGIQFPNNHVTGVNMQPACFANITSFIPFNNDLAVNCVNAMLIGLDGNGKTNGIANFGGGTNAAPTGAGITAKNNLIAKGWTVITN